METLSASYLMLLNVNFPCLFPPPPKKNATCCLHTVFSIGDMVMMLAPVKHKRDIIGHW